MWTHKEKMEHFSSLLKSIMDKIMNQLNYGYDKEIYFNTLVQELHNENFSLRINEEWEIKYNKKVIGHIIIPIELKVSGIFINLLMKEKVTNQDYNLMRRFMDVTGAHEGAFIINIKDDSFEVLYVEPEDEDEKEL